MRLTLESGGHVMLEIEADEEGHYTIRGDRLMRQPEKDEYQTDDGLHVAGLIMAYFGALDARAFLTRALKERVGK